MGCRCEHRPTSSNEILALASRKDASFLFQGMMAQCRARRARWYQCRAICPMATLITEMNQTKRQTRRLLCVLDGLQV